jgi:hypothetical protein
MRFHALELANVLFPMQNLDIETGALKRRPMVAESPARQIAWIEKSAPPRS